MKRILLVASTTILLVTGSARIGKPAFAAHPAAGAPGMQIQITSPTGPVMVAPKGKFTVYAKIEGMHFDPGGGKNANRHGRVQIFIDCIPWSAYASPQLSSFCWYGYFTHGTSNGPYSATVWQTFDLKTLAMVPPNLRASRLKIGPGAHLFMALLARNDNVLYQTPGALIQFVVK